MALVLSGSAVGQHLSRLERLRSRYQSAVEKTHHAASTAVRTATVGAAAFAVSAVQARYGGVTVAKLDLPLAAGIAGHLAAFAGVGRDTAQHLHNMADGALAVWAASKGAQQGLKWREKKGLSAAPGEARKPSKWLPFVEVHGEDLSGQSLSDDELSRLASRT